MRVVALWFSIAGCASSSPPSAARPATPPSGGGAHASPATPVDTPSTAGTDSEIVARVVARGPVGDGNCTQCSLQILVEEHFTGDVETSTTPIWVHYEHCPDTPRPPQPPDALDPCGLRDGPLYVLTLRRGASRNFGDAPMILTARPRPIE